MNKWMKGALAAITLLSLLLMLQPSAMASGAAGSFQVTGKSVTVYDSQTMEALAYLREGEVYHYLSKDDDYFYVQIEQANGRVANQPHIAIESEQPNRYYEPTLPPAAGQLVTAKAVTVYNVHGRAIGQVAKDRRMQYYGQHGTQYIIYIGHVRGYVQQQDVALNFGIPVITYHALEDTLSPQNINRSTYISTAQFQRNMSYLADEEYETISLDDLVQYLQKKKNLGRKVIAITFDDGLQDSMDIATPILAYNGQHATQFVITGRAVYTGYVTAQSMVAYEHVFRFEGHTHSLHNMLVDREGKQYSELTTRTLEDIRTDLIISKHTLPDQTHFAYPFGKVNDTIIEALKIEGFIAGYTVTEGYVTPDTDPFRIPRFSVYQHTTDEEFQRIFTGVAVPK